MLKVKRVYESRSDGDGFRILVDRLWPRGLRKDEAGVDLWLKDIAPSAELRRWFGHDPQKWEEFGRRYRDELDRNSDAVEALRQAIAGKDKVTLLYAARDDKHNNAVALRDFIEGMEK
jgi:uncharacterized protein YeaO (DUF488 family)